MTKMSRMISIKIWLARQTRYIPIPFIQRWGGRVVGRQLAVIILNQVEMYKEVMNPKGIYSTLPPMTKWVMSMGAMTSMVYICYILQALRAPVKEVNNASI